MRIFDPHIHMTSRTTDDYQAMYAAGVRAVTEPAFWLGQPRTTVGSFRDYFDTLVGWERFRAAQFGIRHHCTIALNPKEANDPRLAGVLDLLPRYLVKDGVVAVGETGFDAMTEAEEKVLIHHLDLAREHGLPVLVHTPHRDKAEGTRRTLELVAASGLPPGMVLIDHLNEVTVGLVADSGCWMGFSIYPDTKMDEGRMTSVLKEYGTERMIVNSAADWGRSDPLKTAKTGAAMRAAGFSEDDVDKVLWRNPVEFYAQSGRLLLDEDEDEDVAGAATWEGNSILRGERKDPDPAPEAGGAAGGAGGTA
ncbi:TatD family hydrolase [Streptomyces xiamenensis]|uniref:TatD family hydrolase n=1 Tax=Streptomyces xiamenensis TaxID=408015 RepID=UPI0037D7366C